MSAALADALHAVGMKIRSGFPCDAVHVSPGLVTVIATNPVSAAHWLALGDRLPMGSGHVALVVTAVTDEVGDALGVQA